MIVSISISNFRSFLSEETFSLVASKRLSGSHEGHVIPIPDCKEGVLKTAALYGANGAGKSNLFKALRYIQKTALAPRKKGSGTGREAFRFEENSSNPSSFDLQFIAADKLYRFGFKANDQRITEEWLVQVIGSKEKTLYERITDENGNVTVELHATENMKDKVKALAIVGGPQNQSFLATMHTTLDDQSFGEDFGGVLKWFKDTLTLVAPNESFRALGHTLANDSNFCEFAGKFLKASSTGVDHLEALKKELTEDELHALLPSDVISKVMSDFENEEDGTALIRLGEGSELLIERSEEDRFYSITIQAAHVYKTGKLFPLELNQESDGTRRLLNLIPALHELRTGGAVYFIDEIDRSMHPILAWNFLEFFLKSCTGTQCQIILTTHESNLLDLNLLRRDEIWFVEKDMNSSTRLYSLADFKVRNDLKIRNHYLDGRFGAVPFIGGFDHLIEEECHPE